MPRVVVDPGVLISALLSPTGTPARLRRAAAESLFDLVVSPRLLEELEMALLRDDFRRYVSVADAVSYVDGIRRDALLVEDAEVAPAVTPDPKDDYLVALARATDAVLVSGDRHLVRIRGVLTPRAFVDALQFDS